MVLLKPLQIATRSYRLQRHHLLRSQAVVAVEPAEHGARRARATQSGRAARKTEGVTQKKAQLRFALTAADLTSEEEERAWLLRKEVLPLLQKAAAPVS